MNGRPDPEGVRFLAATPERLSHVIGLAGSVKLPTEDLHPAGMAHFEQAIDREGRVVGCAGVEVCAGIALLRSVAVSPDWRGCGLGRRLVARREAVAKDAGARFVYLLTTDADAFFLHLGYEELPREAVPQAIADHPQFRCLCPASAKCLGKRLQ